MTEKEKTKARIETLYRDTQHLSTQNECFSVALELIKEIHLASRWGRWLLVHQLICDAKAMIFGLEYTWLDDELIALERLAWQHAHY